MVAGMAAPAYADVYYIGDGNITITKDENGTQVQQGNSTKNDTDRDIVIKGGTNPANTASGGSSSGSNSSKSTTLAKSPAQSNLTTLNSEDDSDSEAEDKVYLGDTKGGGEENENQTGGTTGGEKNETDFTKKTQPSRSPVLESQITYTGPSLKVADANDDEETRDESTTALKTAAENFRNTAENVTNYVIRIINKVKDSTLNVTLEDVNIKANNDAALSVEGAGNTTITLKGDNTLTSDGKHAGLEHNEKSDGGATTGKLTITSETDKNGNNTSSLTATGSGGSAGIGSAWSKSGSSTGAGTIEIVGGDIKAIGASSAAGIGSGYGATSDTDIIISGTAKIEAESTYGGAGIGSGKNSTGETNIIIKSGTITKATGGKYGGAGIGSGYYGGSSTVNISGNAKLKNVTGGEDGGAGIGSGYSSSSSSVTISGGTVNAAGNQYSTSGSSGIGGNSTDVTISGGNITATGYGTGAGIGSYDDNSSTITATGNDKAPAIGNGSVSISNADAPLDITATAPVANKAIQSSDGKTLDDVIRLKENDTLGLVTLVESGTYSISRLFHNGFYAANVPSFHSPNRVEAEMSEAEKAQYGDISSVHNWKVSNREDPTCGKDGYIDYICMVGKCGATFRHTLPATGQHTWNEGVVTRKPTCTEKGVRTFTCSVCHNIRTEDIPTTGEHQWKLLSTTAATCGQDGTVTYQCEVCNETKTETLNATGQHSYGAGVVTKAATCAEPGIMTYTCVVCNDSYTESIPVDKSTHKWDAGVVTKEPTCTADGVRTFTCSVCGDTRTEAIKALGHEYGEWVIDRDATCVEEGSKHRDCIRGDDTQTEVIPVSKTHTFGEWVITKEPTCTEKGERQRSCTISGCVVTETEELPALGHQWSDWTPVKGDSSREYRICEVCNEVEYRDVSHNSDSSISTGLRVLDPAQANIIQNVQLVQLSQINHTLYIHVAHETASLQGDLSDLTDLRSENIQTVVFSTESCTSTLSLSDVAALGAGSTPFALSHSGSTSTFTVGGADHTALLR